MEVAISSKFGFHILWKFFSVTQPNATQRFDQSEFRLTNLQGFARPNLAAFYKRNFNHPRKIVVNFYSTFFSFCEGTRRQVDLILERWNRLCLKKLQKSHRRNVPNAFEDTTFDATPSKLHLNTGQMATLKEFENLKFWLVFWSLLINLQLDKVHFVYFLRRRIAAVLSIT